MTDEPLIFLSYASQNRDRVLPFYDRMKSTGLNAWMDKHELKGGQDWDFEIKKALAQAAIIIAFLSHESVNKRGYVQRELKVALDQAETKLAGDIYLIPVLLDDDVTIPDQLAHLHAISGDFETACTALADSIRAQFEKLGAVVTVAEAPQPITWKRSNLEENWDGLPGYETKLEFIELCSTKFPNVSEINDIVRGWLVGALHAERRVKFDQSPNLFSFGQDRWQRTNTWEAAFSDPVITGATISVLYSIWWYGAGAAHPNHNFRAFCFSLDPLIQIESLQDIFTSPEAGLRTLQEHVREHFLARKDPGDETEYSEDWVNSGTEDWQSFQSFQFTKDGVEIFFPPYQIASYADGIKSVVVPYLALLDLVDKNFQHLLGIAYLRSAIEWQEQFGSGENGNQEA